MTGLEPGTSDVGSGHSTYKLSHNHSHKNVNLFMAQCVFKKWANPDLFLVYFLFFQTNNTTFTTNQCEKMSCPSSIQRQDSNSRPSERESPPITTRPGPMHNVYFHV